MNTLDHFIFRSSELFLLNDNTLPGSVPPEFAEKELDRFSFRTDGRPALAVSLEAGPPESFPACEAGYWIALRAVFASMDPALAKVGPGAARALGLANWHKETRFCPRCGFRLEDHATETARHCESCGNLVFPRLSPAIITLVRKDDTILLARHANRNTNVWACIAGYLEHGESLEDCVKREVLEETGLTVGKIRYAGSQSWPFPDQFMVAFYAEWVSGEIKVDPAEIAEARWFPRDDLPATPPPGSVAWGLIQSAIRGQDRLDCPESERFVLTPRT